MNWITKQYAPQQLTEQEVAEAVRDYVWKHKERFGKDYASVILTNVKPIKFELVKAQPNRIDTVERPNTNTTIEA
jgi:uncharacterized protein YqeY